MVVFRPKKGQAILKVDRDMCAVFPHNLSAIVFCSFKIEEEIRMFVRKVCVR
jgi:hypothetical protein